MAREGVIPQSLQEPTRAAAPTGALPNQLARVHDTEALDAAEIRALVEMLVRVNATGMLRSGSAAHLLPMVAVEDAGESIRWDSQADWGEPPYLVEFRTYNTVYRLLLDRLTRTRAGHLTPLPHRVERLRRRLFRRTETRGPLTVSVRLFLSPERPPPRHAIADISYGGFCLAPESLEGLEPVGLALPHMAVFTESGSVIRCRGRVRFVAKAKSSDEGARCGIQIEPVSVHDQERWQQLVGQHLGARTCSSGHLSEACWELLESSGYFSLSGRHPEDFRSLKPAFIRIQQVAEASPRLFCHAGWPSQRGFEATVALTKAYSGAWLGHQLAKRPGRPPGGVPSRQVLRDVYFRVFEHAHADAACRWVLGYIEANVSWMREVHLDFVRPYVSSGEAYVLPLRLICGSVDTRSANGAEEVVRDALSFNIGPPRADDVAALLAVLSRRRPRAYRDALDLAPVRIALEGISAQWAERGLHRERGLLFARSHEKPVAAALLEVGDLGTNPFQLLDGLRLVALRPGGRRAFPALLAAARRWYGARDRQRFVYFLEGGEAKGMRVIPAAWQDLGAGYLWIISAGIVPDFLEHVHEHTRPRLSAFSD